MVQSPSSPPHMPTTAVANVGSTPRALEELRALPSAKVMDRQCASHPDTVSVGNHRAAQVGCVDFIFRF